MAKHLAPSVVVYELNGSSKGPTTEERERGALLGNVVCRALCWKVFIDEDNSPGF